MKLKISRIKEKRFRKCIQNMSTIKLSWQFEKCNKDEDQKNFLGKDFRILAFAKRSPSFTIRVYDCAEQH